MEFVVVAGKTGCKIFNFYKDDAREALTGRSPRPMRYANQLPEPVEAIFKQVPEDQRTAGQAPDRRCAHAGTLRAIDDPFATRLSPMS
jgi:hypothetical protein